MSFKYVVAFLVSFQVWLSSCFNANKVASVHMQQESQTVKGSFYDLEAISLDGQKVNMSEYKGKKIIILNTASKCGYTPQYADWQKYYEANQKNVVVLGFPCNQFMDQEPGSKEEIASFCQKNYGVTFPMFEKVDVKGNNQHIVYNWLSDPSKNGWCSDVPSWNFCKYVVDEKGQLTHFFGSNIKPDSPEFAKAMVSK